MAKRNCRNIKHIFIIILLIFFIQLLLFNYILLTVVKYDKYPWIYTRSQKSDFFQYYIDIIKQEGGEETKVSFDVVKISQNVRKPSTSHATKFQSTPTPHTINKTAVLSVKTPNIFSCNSNISSFHKDTQSALHRVRSEKCKNKILEIACLTQIDQFYWTNITKSCPLSRPKSQTIAKIKEESSHDPPIRIMYALVVHGRAYRQIKRLFKALYHKDHYFYFHVDSRSKYLYRKLKELENQFKNVKISSWRMATIWGGASLLHMLLRMMEDTLKMKNWKWDFFINLSAACYPIQKDSKLTKYLRSNRNRIFLSTSVKNKTSDRKQGLYHTFVECDEHMWRLGDRNLIDSIDFYTGSDWIVLNREFAQYVVYSQDTLVLGLKHLYSYTLLSAESFFVTLAMNSQYCNNIKTRNFHMINWDKTRGCSCDQYKHAVDWCGCSPMDFNDKDINSLKNHRKKKFFARKFEPTVHHEIINKLDFWLYGNYPKKTPGLRNYWENLFSNGDDKIEKFDVYRTFLHSFARISSRNVTRISCKFNSIKTIKEGSYLMVNGTFEGVLTLFDIQVTVGQKRKKIITLETLFKPKKLDISWTDNMKDRLTSLRVGTNYDRKERVFRNYGGMIGPNDSLTLEHRWKEGDEIRITIIWRDPLNVIAGTYYDKVKENITTQQHFEPTLKQPLYPGTWTVEVLHENISFGNVKFLVIPQAYVNGKDTTFKNAIMNYHSLKQSQTTVSEIKSVTKNAGEVEDLTLYPILVGDDLHHLVDKHILNHWEIKETCLVDKALINYTCNHIKQCKETNWSSRSPDPKSELGTVNKNGRLR